MRINPKVVSKEFREKTVLFNTETGDYLVLNATAAGIWNRLESKQRDGIIPELIATYDITESLAKESYKRLIRQLEEESMLIQ